MNTPQLLVIGGILIAVILVLFLPLPRFQRKASAPADRPPTPVVFHEDDRYWYGGFFYNNPDDHALFVPRHFGFGWTMNFGHPRAKPILIIILVMLLLLALLPPLLVALLGGTSTGCHTFGC